MCSMYSITYQYKPEEWHSHYDIDQDTADMILRMLWSLSRNCRVRHNPTGLVREVNVEQGKEPLTLLHLFSKSISGRCGKDTDE